VILTDENQDYMDCRPPVELSEHDKEMVKARKARLLAKAKSAKLPVPPAPE
jgi:hypothetical protein